MKDIFLTPYNPKDTEPKLYKLWKDSGFFDPETLVNKGIVSKDAKPFTIVMPPPNANGDLHAGHSLFITLEDIMTRYKRMSGYRALWIPGADHAGFETQVVYEKKLEKEGRSRFGMDPKDLYKEILDFTLTNKKNMEAQVESLGASCDWSREKFTLDPEVVSKTQDAFIKMWKDGIAYRGKRTINWCSKHQTSLSEVETESSEETSPFYYFK
jgi:valyl-tRNA synthetase